MFSKTKTFQDVPCGNTVALVGVDQYILRLAVYWLCVETRREYTTGYRNRCDGCFSKYCCNVLHIFIIVIYIYYIYTYNDLYCYNVLYDGASCIWGSDYVAARCSISQGHRNSGWRLNELILLERGVTPKTRGSYRRSREEQLVSVEVSSIATVLVSMDLTFKSLDSWIHVANNLGYGG